MARAAVLDLLRNDSTLADLGGDGFVVVPQFSQDQRPNGEGMFVVIVWRTTDFAAEIQANGLKYFDVYVHIPIGKSTDFGRLDEILDRVDEIFGAVPGGAPVLGGDGYQLDHIGFHGRSFDIADSGYETICRFGSYSALSCKANA